MATEEEGVMPSDAEMFEQSTTPEPKPEAPEAKADDEGTKGERLRDEKGRFASENKEETPVEAAPPPEEKPVPEEKEQGIPSWRLREEAEARREAERRTQQLEHMLSQYEARLRDAYPQQQPELPDFFAHPEALPQYFEHMLAQRESHWKQEFRQAVANMSLQRAHDRHGELFMEAFNAITALPLESNIRQQVINAPDPGEVMVKLYKDQKSLSAIGNEGLDSFLQKKLDAALEDPAFLAKALEKARGVAGNNPTQQIRTPPSLNKATGSRVVPDDDEVTDEKLYKLSTQR